MEDRKRHIRWGLAGGAAVILISAAVLLIRIFSAPGTGKSAEQEKDSPQAVLAGFYSELISGRREQALSYCDTTGAVAGYVRDFCDTTAMAWQEEQGIFPIISEMIDVEVTGKRTYRDGTEIDFILTIDGAADSLDAMKEKKALMKKTQEGRWAITDITAR